MLLSFLVFLRGSLCFCFSLTVSYCVWPLPLFLFLLLSSFFVHLVFFSVFFLILVRRDSKCVTVSHLTHIDQIDKIDQIDQIDHDLDHVLLHLPL